MMRTERLVFIDTLFIIIYYIITMTIDGIILYYIHTDNNLRITRGSGRARTIFPMIAYTLPTYVSENGKIF